METICTYIEIHPFLYTKLSSQVRQIHPDPAGISVNEPPRLELPLNRVLPPRQNRVLPRQNYILDDGGVSSHQPRNDIISPITRGVHAVARRGNSICGIVIFGEICPEFDRYGNQFRVEVKGKYATKIDCNSGKSLRLRQVNTNIKRLVK